ncbi:MAG: MFS transporter [Bacteroidetes bacterium]|nr:MFS transporter [Bacteroidota bacterium]MCL6100004.1 MFS transporter [Bacteroidota bacterium]
MNPWRGLQNIPRNIWLLAFTTLINRSGTMVLPYLVLYMTEKIRVGPAEAGLVLAFYGAGGLITAPFVGKLSDRIGALRIMKFSLIATGIMLFMFSFITNYYLILFITLVWSVINESFRPANLSFISKEVLPEQRKTSFALNRLAINLGMSIGPVIGGFLAALNFSFLFYVDGITSLIAGVFLIFSHIKPESEIKDAEEKLTKTKSVSPAKYQSVFHDKKFLIYMLALIPAEMVFFQHIGALPLYLVRDLKFVESTFGMLMAINTVIIIFIEVPLNNFMARWDERKLIAVGALLCGLGYGLMILSSSILLIIFTVVVWTFGEMIFFPSSASYIAEISPEAKRGEYMGYFQMTFSFSMMLGPWLGTIVLDNFGASVLWLSAFGFGLLSMLIFQRKGGNSLKTN